MNSPAIEIHDLTKIFRRPLPRLKRLLRLKADDEITALKDVNLVVPMGEIYGLVGRNGQGKTTLIKCISALVEPTHGEIAVLGMDARHGSSALRQKIGLVTSEERSFYWRLTAVQNLRFFARLQGMGEKEADKRIADLLALFGMESLSHRRFQEFSTGNRQKLAIVRALLTHPRILLLDEPSRSLDPIAAADLRNLIRKLNEESEGATILIATHNLAEIEEICTRVAFISKGSIKENAPLSELKIKYAEHEHVKLHLAQMASPDGLSLLKNSIPSLAWSLDANKMEITFSRKPGDDVLHRIIEHVVANGARIQEIESQKIGLKRIMEQIEMM